VRINKEVSKFVDLAHYINEEIEKVYNISSRLARALAELESVPAQKA
jgi:hypothetical protein